MKIRRKALSLFLASVIVVTVIFFTTVRHYIKTSLIPANQSFHFILQPGETIKTLAQKLHTQGYIHYPLLLIAYARLTGQADKIQAGEYLLQAGSTPQSIVKQLVNGKVVLHEFTIVDGWNIYQLMEALNKAPYLQHNLEDLSIQDLAKLFAIDHKTPEGYFFPDTYQYTLGDSETDILSKAHKMMMQKLYQSWPGREPDLPYKTVYQALIVASMVEKETALASERPVIAGVIIKRLEKHMYLQIDPTVIYGLGPAFNGNITIKDLRSKTPYNTYTRKGLPPTPIAMPGEGAIEAALHPDLNNNYLYFVAKGDGSHEFSATLKQHDAAIRRFILHKPNS